MPSQDDVELVRRFLDEVVETYLFVLNHPRILRSAEREELRTALAEFAEAHPARITQQYAELDDEDAIDAGIYGDQLRSKYRIARLARHDLVKQAPVPPVGRRRVRRWIKRVKVLGGSLKTLIPGAEALLELLDLLDGALDSA